MRAATAVAITLASGCGGTPAQPVQAAATRPVIETVADRILPLLPDGAQLIVELDLARLRANPVVGALVTQVLTGDDLVGLPGGVPRSPLAHSDVVVLASYGLGTGQAATVTVLATTELVAGGVRVGDGLVALGPDEWVGQLEARAALANLGPGASGPPILASAELLALRARAMPTGAPGATLRLTARLSFDARVALTRQTGLEAAPAQVSIWADVVDDFAIIIDADAADPGDRGKRPARALERGLRGVLAALAEQPAVRALGIPASLSRARFTAQGTWVRTIIAIGPQHLARVVARAKTYLEAKS